MKIEIKIKGQVNGYYVEIMRYRKMIYYSDMVLDEDISKLLKENVENYQMMGIKYNGFLKKNGLYFNNKKDIKRFIEEVMEPRLIINSLNK